MKYVKLVLTIVVSTCLINLKGQIKIGAPISDEFYYLALGDSYTIGESVEESFSFPFQLARAIESYTKREVDCTVVATTGWTTTDLINSLYEMELKSHYNLVTLLIGVNNQYQGKDFSLYEREFVQLLEKSIEYASGIKNNVRVVSIPDYAYTPFGQKKNVSKISKELDRYNSYAREISFQRGVEFIYITDITREGLNDTDLVADDELHPSGKAYAKFVKRILPSIFSSD